MRLKDAATELGKGQLGVKVAIKSKDEIGELAAAFNKMSSDLQNNQEQIQLQNEELNTSNEELKSANEEITATNEELRQANEELESTTEELRTANEEAWKAKDAAEKKSAELEQRKEREARDRAVYESTNYRYEVKDILNGAVSKMGEATSALEATELEKRTEAKINKLTSLDQQAEELVSQKRYEEARNIYEEIMGMSKDPDLKKYIGKQK